MVLDGREDEVRDACVVPHHIPLGVFLLREENLVEVRDLEFFPAAEVQVAIYAFFFERRQLFGQRCRINLVAGRAGECPT